MGISHTLMINAYRHIRFLELTEEILYNQNGIPSRPLVDPHLADRSSVPVLLLTVERHGYFIVVQRPRCGRTFRQSL